MNYDEYRDTIASVTPAVDIVGDSFCELWLLTEAQLAAIIESPRSTETLRQQSP